MSTTSQPAAKPINAFDLEAPRREAFFRPPKMVEDYFEAMIEDKRDMIMVHLCFNIVFTIFPFAAYLFSYTTVPVYVGILYTMFLYGMYIQRFILLLHYSQHRKLFGKLNPWNNLIPYLLTPFFGVPSGLYFAHHIIMHHQENNLDGWDASSTEGYQRNRFSSFLRYWARWIIGVWFQLPFYLFRRSQWKLLNQYLYCLFGWVLVLTAAYRFNPTATFWVFLLPVLITQFLLSFGNYSQHIFVDPDRPRDNYTLAYCCINNLDNQYSFNDGYHITHHLNARLHWSLMPQRFLDNFENYKNGDAIIFNGISFFEVGILIFTGNLKLLASYYVQIQDKKRSESEIIALFERRFEPVRVTSTISHRIVQPKKAMDEFSSDDE